MIFEDIDWQTGLLIKPQHMQFIKQCNYYGIFSVINKYIDYMWGVVELEYDDTKISEGILGIRKLHCINKDGSIINITEKDNLVVHVDENNDEDDFFVYVASVVNSYDNISNDARYKKDTTVKINDRHNIEAPEHMMLIKVKAYFMFKKDLSHNHVYFPLIKIKKYHDSFVVADYIPPTISFEKNSPLIKKINSMLKIIADKIIYLKDKIRLSIESKNLNSTALINLRNHDLISTQLSRIQQLIDSSDKIIPKQIFQELFALAHAVVIVTNSDSIINIQYNHEKLTYSIYGLITSIENKMHILLNTEVEVVEMICENKCYFYKSIEQCMISHNKILIQCIYNYSHDVAAIKNMIENASIEDTDNFDNINKLRVLGWKKTIIEDMNSIAYIATSVSNSVYFYVNVPQNKTNFSMFIHNRDINQYKLSFNIIYKIK